MRRGSPEHVTDDAAKWVGTASWREWVQRNTDAIHRNIRNCNLADAEACRATVQAAQSFFWMVDSMERMAHESDARERKVKVV